MRVCIGIVVAAAGLAALTATVARSAPAGPPTVACEKIILGVQSGRAGGYRVVLGVVSVPEAYLPQVVRSFGFHETARWPYWRKAGLVIRGGSRPVTVRVPKAWRNRVAITWGNTRVVSALRIASCPATRSRPWNAYAGGFLLRSPSACVPLVFTVGGRSAVVRFGLAQRCM